MKTFYLSTTKILQTFETLRGLIEGISADKRILPKEIEALKHWIAEHDHAKSRAPFDEIIHTIQSALADNVITESELKDIRFVCEKVIASFSLAAKGGTAQIQRLHGIASGIAADGELHPAEWSYLSNWLQENQGLKGSWPFDEIDALTTKYGQSQKLTPEEKEVVLYYLNDFCGLNGNSTITHPLNEPFTPIEGICAACPNIQIAGKTFCITGESHKHLRKDFVEMISSHGGIIKSDISKTVDYLIVCAEGSPMWSYSCYGRKVEAAVSLRRQGHRILIVHEYDFLDAIADAA